MERSFLLKRILILIGISVVFFFFGNNFISLTNPDEVFYAQTAKEMAAKGQWLTPYIFNQPQFEKPIFTYWLLGFAHDMGGMTPFSMRFFPALFAMLGVLAVYALGFLGFQNERKAFWSAVVLATMCFYAGMGRLVFTDMVFTVLILYSLLSFYLAYAYPRQKTKGVLGFYFFAALAVLTKGPLGWVIPELIVVLFLLYRREISFLIDRRFAWGLMLLLLIAVPWYLWMVMEHGQNFIQEFFYNGHWRRFLEAEHPRNDTWYFYPFSMIWATFPWSLFLIGAFVALYKKLKWGAVSFEYFLLSWVIAIFVLFQASHSKLVTYILPMFPALALLTGGYIEDCIEQVKVRAVRVSIMIMAGLYFVVGITAIAVFPFYEMYISSQYPIYFLASLLVVLAGGLLTLIFKERFYAALGVLSCSFLPFLFTAFLIASDLEPYISSQEIHRYIPSNATQTTILTSKPFARGIHFYTDKNVAVLDINGKGFFSPHPIPYLNTNEKLIQFLQGQKITYAVVKEDGRDTLQALPADQFRVQIIQNLRYNYLLAVEPLNQS